MSNQRTYMVIIDPTEPSQPALERALIAASRANANILAWLCTYKNTEEMGDAHSAKDGKHQQMATMEAWLNARIAEHQVGDITITTHIEWNERWWERAVAMAAKSGADAVFKSVSSHRNAYRKLFRTSDFYLMRHCASPVLLLHKQHRWQNNTVLVTLDYESNDPTHERLNNAALASARRIATIMGAQLHAMTVRSTADGLDHLLQGEDEGAYLEGIISDRTGIPFEYIMIQDAIGDVASTICDAAETLNPDILVIGTVARTGMAGMVIGNTAEKVLDRVACDVLTVC